MKKKFILGIGLITMLVVLIFMLTGCGEKENKSSESEKPSTSDEEKQNNKPEDNKDGAKTNKEVEDEAFHTNYGELDKYDSEVFYANDRKISYKVLDKFASVKKEITTTQSCENYELVNGKETVYLDIELKKADLYDDYFKIFEGKEGLNDPAEGLLAFYKKSENIMSEAFEDKKAGFAEDKIVQIGDYKVYYTTFNDNTLGENGSEAVNIIATFAVDSDYLIGITMSSFIKNADSNKVSLEELKPMIESFKVEKY